MLQLISTVPPGHPASTSVEAVQAAEKLANDAAAVALATHLGYRRRVHPPWLAEVC